ncbi:MAG: hypothetical protein K8T26_00135 [Lentisphaerae bacterium]|nr:hypothetical protein [Lentisphaerota bacterium]
MSYEQFDRGGLTILPLGVRQNKVRIAHDAVKPDAPPRPLGEAGSQIMAETVARMRAARRDGRPVILAFGAHAIKNGLAPVLIRLMEQGWLTHLATNGAGIIHDWEFAFQGQSSEDVRGYVSRGQFGLWQETGRNLNLAIIVGAWEGLGYGESIGAMIHRQGLDLPTAEALRAFVREHVDTEPERCAAAADLLDVVLRFHLPAGWMPIPHPFAGYSAQAAAYRLKIPFTGHPMIGHDIIYTHPINHGAAIGRTALRDFLTYTEQVRQLEGGVYLSVGSAVMSPMIFEKALSMARNVELQAGRRIDNHYIAVVDLAASSWDWQKDGEPPQDNPAYYLRYCKTFSRMGGTMRYLCADNRDFFLTLSQALG